MDETALVRVMRALGVAPTRARNRKGWIEAHCPLAPWTHKSGRDNTPSAAFKVNPIGRSAWTCLSCKGHGTIPALIQRVGQLRGEDLSSLYNSVGENEELAGLAQDFGAFEAHPWLAADEDGLTSPLVEEAWAGLYPAAWDHPESRAYLVSRGITEETSRTLGLMFTETKHRIMFPVRDGAGALWGFSNRATLDHIKPKILDGDLPKRRLILGQHRWRAEEPILLVEGLFGYAWLLQLGVERYFNLGALMGSVLTPEKRDILVGRDAPVWLLCDNDAAGRACIHGPLNDDGVTRRRAEGAAEMLADYVPVFLPEWPAGKDDPDQLTLAEVQHMAEATPLYIPQRKKSGGGGRKPVAKKSGPW
jgi:hypothetical protein